MERTAFQTEFAPLVLFQAGERLVAPLVTIDLGHMPSRGFITYSLPLGGPYLPDSPLFQVDPWFHAALEHLPLASPTHRASESVLLGQGLGH